MEKLLKGTFEKHSGCGYVILENKKKGDKDIFVQKRNSKNAFDKDKVEVKIIKEIPGKNPEGMVVRILKDTTKKFGKKETITGIYSSGNGKFGFVDMPGVEKGVFVHNSKNFGAQDGDKVKAYIQNYNGKKEAIIFEILENENKIAIGKFQDFESYGFVVENDYGKDIFIPGNNINEADHNDIVEVEVIRETGKNPQGRITKIIKESIGGTQDFEIINDFDSSEEFDDDEY